MGSLEIKPKYRNNEVAICMQSSEEFAPYTSVLISSIINNASVGNNYDILLLTEDITADTSSMIMALSNKSNISIRVVNVKDELKPYRKIALNSSGFKRFSYTGLIRLLLPNILENYEKVLNLDCDMLVRSDVAEIYNTCIDQYYVAGVQDIICYINNKKHNESLFTNAYLYEVLNLESIEDYFNGGLWLLNLKKIREDFTIRDILEYATKNKKKVFRCYEQDVFSGLFGKNKLRLPFEYNWFVDAADIISKGKNFTNPSDCSIQMYYAAEAQAKVLHYLTDKKPWVTHVDSYSKIWWQQAKESPFFETILRRMCGDVSQISKKKMKILFVVETEYQLFNILNLKINYFNDVTSDIVFLSTVNLTKYIEKIRALALFENIFETSFSGFEDRDELAEIDNKVKAKNPEKYDKMISISAKYTDFFMPTPGVTYQKMIYYMLINHGSLPRVHIFEEGLASYTEDIVQKLKWNIDDSVVVKRKRIGTNLSSIFLYMPKLYSGSENDLSKILMPTVYSDTFRMAIYNVFGKGTPIEEKYIYFNEPFMRDGLVSNEIQILDNISEIVGKENIAIKLHPQSKGIKKLFEAHGYHVLEDNNIPWEIYTLFYDVDDKVLLSISSNAIFSPFIICNKYLQVISLLEVMNLSRRAHAISTNYHVFLRKIREEMNQNGKYFHSPLTINELCNVLKYIEMGGEAVES